MCVKLNADLRYESKYKKVGVLPIGIVKSSVSSVGPSSDEGKAGKEK